MWQVDLILCTRRGLHIAFECKRGGRRRRGRRLHRMLRVRMRLALLVPLDGTEIVHLVSAPPTNPPTLVDSATIVRDVQRWSRNDGGAPARGGTDRACLCTCRTHGLDRASITVGVESRAGTHGAVLAAMSAAPERDAGRERRRWRG